MAATDKRAWFITGCSTGFGREMARSAVAAGYPTVVTARKPDDLKGVCWARWALDPSWMSPDQAQIDAAITGGEAHFGRIDVLANNAPASGISGSVRGKRGMPVRRMFDINVLRSDA